MNSKIYVLIMLITLVIGGGLVYFFLIKKPAKQTLKDDLTWEECIKMPGSKVQFSYPGTCVTSKGKRIVQPLSEKEKQDLEKERENINEQPNEHQTEQPLLNENVNSHITNIQCDAKKPCPEGKECWRLPEK